jgi:hypothetical protein
VIDKESLLKASVPEAEVEVPGKGTVRCRGLTRAEYLEMGIIGQQDLEKAEVFMISHGLIDPALSEAEVTLWRASVSAGEIDPVTGAINELSGLGETALKDAVATFRGRPGDATGISPGPDPGNDRLPSP